MPDWPEETKELIRRMLRVDPNERISIAEIKQHPLFRNGLEDDHILPRPLPMVESFGPIQDVSENVLNILSRIGFDDANELNEMLLSKENTLAKVFVGMLNSKIDLSSLPWGESNKFRCFEENSFSKIRYQFGSLGIMASFVHRWEWDVDEQTQPLIESTKEILSTGLSIWWVMKRVQESCDASSFDWFHPDPQTVYCRSDDGPSYLSVFGRFESQSVIVLNVSLHTGSVLIFDDFCSDLEERINC
uniref:Putative CAMK family protein kinase n=1 Tax=Coptotermes formosanus TaxID=36987 RepID=R4UX14_COPFO|nr:putative CAMK family protein kinase [Coptotermes formosanus]